MMSKPTEGPHTAGAVTDREAAGLLLAFVVAVIFVLSLATTMPPIPIESTGTHEPMGTSQLENPSK